MIKKGLSYSIALGTFIQFLINLPTISSLIDIKGYLLKLLLLACYRKGRICEGAGDMPYEEDFAIVLLTQFCSFFTIKLLLPLIFIIMT